jgi:hypothetical protein
MADNTQKVGVEVEVKGAEKSISSIKDLKTAIKDARNEQIKMAESFGEGSEQYVKASKRVAELKDKVEDLSDSTKSLGGTGLERASAGMQQFGEGLKNLDFQKVKVGLTAMKTAFAAVGIGLIVQLVSYLVENFDSLSKGSGGLAIALRFVADILGGIVETGTKVLNFFTDLIGISSEAERAVEAQGEAFVEASKNSKDAIASQSAEYDRLIGVAKASGKSTVDLEIAKQQAIIDTNKALLQQALTYLQNGGQLDEAKKKLINDELDAIKTASSQIEIIKSTEAKRIQEVNTKAFETKKANDEKLKNANLTALQQLEDAEINNIKNEEQREFARAVKAKERRDTEIKDSIAAQSYKDALLIQSELTLANQLKAINDKAAADKKATQDKADADKKAQDEKNQAFLDEKNKKDNEASDLKIKTDKENHKASEDAKLQATIDGLNAAQAVTDLFFAFKSSKLKKGSAEELANAKKGFQVNKALQLASATLSGVQAVQNAFTTANLSPITLAFPAYPFIQAGLAGVFSAVNIAKIAASKFEGGAGSPETGGGGGGGGGASIPAPPTISNQNANVEGTQFDENGKRIGGKNDNTINVVATVGVDEITAKTNRVNVLEKQSTF